MIDLLPEGAEGKRKLGVIVGVSSLIILGLGVFMLKAGEFESAVTISHQVASDSGSLGDIIWADIEGAVVAPGVYKLDKGARIETVLAAAGGLAENADKAWVEKNVNKAQVLVDGYKLYIPDINEANTQSKVIGLQSKMVSINSGSQSELESLPGIGPVTAQKIIV